MTKKPFFSIIIPALNEEKYLPLLLSDLAKQTIDDFEVILVDGKSEDNTIKETLTYKNKIKSLEIATSEVRNVSIQRNLGAKMSSGEYLVFNDADNRLPEYFLEGLRFQLRMHPVDLFTCWTDTSSKESKDKAIATACNMLIEASFLTKSPSAFGAMIGCRRQIFSKTPKFNPQVGFAEDTDFVRKSFELGFTFKVFRTPRYIYSLRRFHSQGTLKVIQKSAKLLLKYLTNKPIDQEKEYPMGGKNFSNTNPDLIQKINNLLNTPIKAPKIFEKLQKIIESES